MKQFVKQISNCDEEKVNEEISKQELRGYKAISISCATNNWGLYTTMILFEKVEVEEHTK